MDDIMRVSRKMFQASFDDRQGRVPNRNYRQDDGRGGGCKYRKIFETPTSYKEYEKDTVKKCIERELPRILRDFEESYKRANYPESLRYVLGNKVFIKTLKKNIDKFDGDKNLISFMLSEQLMKNRFVYSDEEIRNSYGEVFFHVNSKKFEKFMDKFNLEELDGKQLYINMCNYDDIRPAHVHQRVFNVLGVMYAKADYIDFNYRGILKRLFKEYYTDVIMGILLEKRENRNRLDSEKARKLWSDITNMALNAVEEMERDDIKEFMYIFIKCLKSLRRNNDYMPRISLLNAISGDYINISKVTKRIIDKDEDNKKYFM